MDLKLFGSALAKFLLGLVLVGVLIFLPAGTIGWWRGWLLMGILFAPMFIAGIILMFRNPELLRRRLDAREEQGEQRQVIAASAVMFLAAFVLAGLGYRLGWYMFPDWVSWVGAAVFLVAYALYGEVLRENAYLSRTVGVSEGQQLVDSGLYGVVRHPMYAATVLLFLAMPVVLGSPFSFAVMLCYLPIIVKRINNEEKVLGAELEGYREYTDRVIWRLVPYVW